MSPVSIATMPSKKSPNYINKHSLWLANTNNKKYWLDYISYQLNLHCHLLLYDSEVSKDLTCIEKSYKILYVFISTNSRMHHFSMSLLGPSSWTEGWTELAWPKEDAHTKVVSRELPTATLWWWTNKQLTAVFKNKLHISKWSFMINWRHL